MQSIFCPKPKHGNSIPLYHSGPDIVDIDYMMDIVYTKANSSGSNSTLHLHNSEQMRVFALKAKQLNFSFHHISDEFKQTRVSLHPYGEYFQKWLH